MTDHTTPQGRSTGSAYPFPVDALVPRARELAARLGEIPSRNRLMSELRVGAPKATEIRAALVESGFTPNGHTPQPSLSAGADTIPAQRTWSMSGQVTTDEHPDTGHAGPGTPTLRRGSGKRLRSWPVLLLAAPAFVAIWSGWVGLGGLTGFGIIHPLPGIWDSLKLNTAITLPIGVETYAAYALRVWVSGQVPPRARRFAKYSAIGSLVLGALGQIAYHLMEAEGMTKAPWQITTLVACLPVAVLGMGAALAHLINDNDD
ncbi:MAG: hypothetical protein ACRDPK_00540 [Carbonactinosporaceae bacterium]